MKFVAGISLEILLHTKVWIMLLFPFHATAAAFTCSHLCLKEPMAVASSVVVSGGAMELVLLLKMICLVVRSAV